jgi:hypothetical protein
VGLLAFSHIYNQLEQIGGYILSQQCFQQDKLLLPLTNLNSRAVLLNFPSWTLIAAIATFPINSQ